MTLRKTSAKRVLAVYVMRSCLIIMTQLRGWVQHIFICLSTGAVEGQPCFFATILLFYALPKVTSVLELFVIFERLFLVYCLAGMPSQISLDTSVAYYAAFISICFFCCNMLTVNDAEVVDCGHEYTLLQPSILLQVLSNSVVVNRYNHLYLNKE